MVYHKLMKAVTYSDLSYSEIDAEQYVEFCNLMCSCEVDRVDQNTTDELNIQLAISL